MTQSAFDRVLEVLTREYREAVHDHHSAVLETDDCLNQLAAMRREQGAAKVVSEAERMRCRVTHSMRRLTGHAGQD